MRSDVKKLSTPEEILTAALQAEKAAYRFYDEHSRNTKIWILKEIFEELRDEEKRHIEKIQKRMREMGIE